MFQPQAKIIADSVNPCGDRLTTFVLTYHRMIHSEVMTYRQWSRNCSSSRAIPIAKNIKQVEDLNLYPIHWGANQKGMQAYEEVDEVIQELAMEAWDEARDACIKSAKRLIDLGIHKQVANRLLEPFNTITMVVTATDYSNFFEQRCHPDAQPEIRALADAMKAAYDASEPTKLESGQWHMPFAPITIAGGWELYNLENKIKIATGRCARVSYLNHYGVRSIEDDIKLHDRLLTSKPAHLSPFEHVAQALGTSEARANFTGFKSYRFYLERERQIAREILQPTEQAAKAMKELGL
jgi:thymidylate synthase ThyX